MIIFSAEQIAIKPTQYNNVDTPQGYLTLQFINLLECINVNYLEIIGFEEADHRNN